MPRVLLYTSFLEKLVSGDADAFRTLPVDTGLDFLARVLYVDVKALRRIRRQVRDGNGDAAVVADAYQLYFERRGGMHGLMQRRQKSLNCGRRLRRDGARTRREPPTTSLPLRECPCCRSKQPKVDFRLNYDLVGVDCPICLMPREAAMMAHTTCGHTMCEACAHALVQRGR